MFEQDTIITKDSRKILAKIVEIDTEALKYKDAKFRKQNNSRTTF